MPMIIVSSNVRYNYVDIRCSLGPGALGFLG